jgi:hypothetical protein
VTSAKLVGSVEQTMSTDQYSGANVDDSGIGPSQGGRGQDWPKKIRTLTASELDRLTIDSAGRFYWDGRLVNYEPPESKAPLITPDAFEHAPNQVIEHAPDSAEHSPSEPASDATEHATQLSEDQQSAEAVHAADIEHPVETQMHAVATRDDHDVHSIHDLPDVRAVQHGSYHHDLTAVEVSPPAPVVQLPDRIRLRMSGWQSLGALIVVVCLLIGALGVGALGLVTAHDWVCRTGLIRIQCPAPAAQPAPRPDIPA